MKKWQKRSLALLMTLLMAVSVCAVGTTALADETCEHVWSEWESNHDATCTEDGTKTRECDKCGDTETVADEGSAGHDWSEWYSNDDASCTEDGTKTRWCYICDKEETVADKGSARGHCWTQDDYDYYNYNHCIDHKEDFYCENCNASKSEMVKGLGHDWSSWSSNDDATCIKDGTKMRWCYNCNKEQTAVDKGSATGHDVWEYEANHNATCTKAGTKTGYCELCYEMVTVTNKKDPALGHSYKTVATTKATTKKNGVGKVQCIRCKHVKTAKATIYRISSVKLSRTSYIYNGKVKKPAVTVKDSKGKKISKTYYTVTYKNNKKAGTGKAIVKFKGNYSGTLTKTFKIKKAAQKITAKKISATYYNHEVKDKAKTFLIGAKGKGGKITYKKLSGSKKLTVKKKTGKVTVAKGTKKGTYKIKVKVTAAATTNYKKTTVTKTITVKVKVPTKTQKITVNKTMATYYSNRLQVEKKYFVIGAKATAGKVTYQKVSGNSNLTVNSKTGTVTTAKGTPRGTYKIKVKITAAPSGKYKKTSVTKTIKVLVINPAKDGIYDTPFDYVNAPETREGLVNSNEELDSDGDDILDMDFQSRGNNVVAVYHFKIKIKVDDSYKSELVEIADAYAPSMKSAYSETIASQPGVIVRFEKADGSIIIEEKY